MSELSEESKTLIEDEGPLDEPSQADIDAMHQRVVASLDTLSPAEPAPAPVPSPAPLAPATTSVALKFIGSLVVAAVGSTTLLSLLSTPQAPSSAKSVASTAVRAQPRASLASAPSASVEPSAPLNSVQPAVSLTGGEPPAVRFVRPEPPSKPSVLASSAPARIASEEALLVAAAEAQLRGGHAAAALSLYERHLREYPGGMLRREAISGRVVALCGVGRTSEAVAEMRRFAEQYSNSPALLRMRRACGQEP